MPIIPVRPALTLGLTLTTLAGCQSYQPRPLDARSHLDAWSARAIDDASLSDFIESLDAADHTEPFEPSDGIDLHEAERIALYYNPDLRLSRLRAGVNAASAEHAGRWDDPEFSIEAMRITESVPDRWIVSPSLAFTIPISGRLDAERQRAEASVRASLSRVAEDEWAKRVEIRRAWYEWSAAHLRAERTAALLQSIETLVESTDRLAESGELPATQANLFTIEQVSQSNALEMHRGQAHELRQHLIALMGLSPDALPELNPSLNPPRPGVVPESESFIEQQPTLRRLHDEYGVAEAALLREIRAQYPDLTIGPVYESDQGQSRIGLLGGIPLPILNANTRGIAVARAERELARAAYETALEQLMHELSIVTDRVERLHHQRTRFESQLIPLVDRQLADAQRLLALGESDGLVLLESLRQSGHSAMQLIDARLDEALALIRLESIAGPQRSGQSDNPDATQDPNSHQEVQP